MLERNDIAAALTEISTLLRKYDAGPADYIAYLMDLSQGETERFREAVLDNIMWGGAGSLCDVSFSSLNPGAEGVPDTRRLRRAIIQLVDGLDRAGMADDRVRDRGSLFREMEQRGI